MVPSLITPPPSRSGEATPTKDACLYPVNGAEPEGHWIRLPEALFSSIMAVEPEVNPLYKTSKALSDEWLKTALRMSDKTATVWSRLDIAYMSAICAPHADLETLKLMNDWNGWVFAFDDPFDEGKFANDPIKAAEEVIYTLSTLDNIHPVVSPDENPLRHTLQSCWMRFRERSSPSLQYRWKKHLTMYCVGVLQQVGVQHRATRPTIEEYMDMRAGCVGAYPCIGLMEQNDLCSYRKDLIQGEESNIIFILKDQGMTDQQAVDQIGEMLYDCYRRWHMALANLPFWGEGIDRDVIKFVNGCRNIALGNLHWSLYTFRYLGNDGPEVKRTRMMKLP
ncbi:hypothetical protein FVER53590_13850 [Fusarium verticillioides]|nr:hypothetical protein FVER14953_13850 [Fusarium verticillioides]RBR11543.1 hypothetical protein FVER53590_13850 [Fusarium verticillioides]